MFFFPYLSILKRLALTRRWFCFKIPLSVWPAFPPLMALWLFFPLLGSPRWLPTYTVIS